MSEHCRLLIPLFSSILRSDGKEEMADSYYIVVVPAVDLNSTDVAGKMVLCADIRPKLEATQSSRCHSCRIPCEDSICVVVDYDVGLQISNYARRGGSKFDSEHLAAVSEEPMVSTVADPPW